MKHSKKFSIVIVIFTWFVLLGSHAVKAEIKKFGLTFTGGIHYSFLGDINDWRQGETQWTKEYCASKNFPMEGQWGSIHFGIDARVNFNFYFTEQFGINIGSGYYNVTKGKETITKFYPWGTYMESLTTEVHALPLELGLFYSIPMSSRFHIVLNLGASYFFAKYENDLHYESKNGVESWDIFSDSAEGNGIGFTGGIGIEFLISDAIFLLFEGTGRYAKLGGFEGDVIIQRSTGTDTKKSGVLYFFEYYSTSNDAWYPWLAVRDKPEKPSFRNIRKGHVDISGVALKTGIKIRF